MSDLTAATGSHAGSINGSETPVSDIWEFFGGTGMNYLTSPMVDNGDGTIGMAGWTVTWNGIPAIPMGGDTANFGTDTGLATISCGACNDADNTVIGDGGWDGTDACYDADNTNIGNGGCVGELACYDADNTIIGDQSCNGGNACYNADNANIGTNSCNCDGCCKECVDYVPDNSCNTGGNEDDFDVNGYCEYC